MTDTEHQPEKWFWEAGGDDCPHGPEPDDDSPEWDEWSDRHQWSAQDVQICLDAPAEDMCGACSADHGDAVAWSVCRARPHARAKEEAVPKTSTEHRPVTVFVGLYECLDRECDDYYTEDGDEAPGVETCSHISTEVVCSCQRQANGEYSTDIPCSAAAVPA